MNARRSFDTFRSHRVCAKIVVGMGATVDLERRIERLRSRAGAGPLPRDLLAEIEGLLSEGYLAALREEARSARLRAQLDEAARERKADEVQRLAEERRASDQSARRLRERLELLRTRVAPARPAQPVSA
jgi:hypothetical protein